MKILVFSDSHGARNKIDSAIREHLKYGGIDKVFFLGDGYRDMNSISLAYPQLDIDCVFGNCDDAFTTNEERSDSVFEKIVEVGGIRFMLMHGHKYDVKETYQFAADHAIEKNARILLFGHTHRAEDITIDGTHGGSVRMINPGSCGQWFNASYALIDIIGREILCGFGQFN